MENGMKRMMLPAVFVSAGVAILFVVWNPGAGPSDNHTETNVMDVHPVRESGTIASNGLPQPSDLPESIATTRVDDADRPSPGAPPPAIEADAAVGIEVAPDGSTLYTMDTLPQGESGVYWVRDSDGSVVQIAVDVPGPDSPAGVEEP